MTNELLQSILFSTANFLLLSALVAIFRLHKSMVTFKLYLRLICDRLDIKCGKDLD